MPLIEEGDNTKAKRKGTNGQTAI